MLWGEGSSGGGTKPVLADLKIKYDGLGGGLVSSSESLPTFRGGGP